MMIPDLNTSCRLCFKNTGENDVTTAPSLYATIKDYYNVEIKDTDKYTKLICAECTSSVYAFCWHKKVVDAGQKLLADSIEMSEQMSHMKIEPPTDMDRSNAIATVEKQEEDEEEDLDDTMTEGAPSPESAGTIPEPEAQAMPPPVAEQPVSQSIRERRSSVRCRRVSRSKERNEVWEIEKLQTNLNGNNGEAAIVPSRIRMRRQTMVVERPKSPKPVKSAKRRLSVMERSSDFDSHRKLNRTAAETVTEMAPSKAKKMRLNSGVPEKQAEPESTPKPSKHGLTQAKSTPNRNHAIAPDTTSTTKTPTTAIVSSTPGKLSTILLTPANRLTPKQRDKKSKNGSSTPLITQFFSQASPLKCDECPAILNSRNELNFHMKIHKRGRCTKCKETIDNNNRAESIQKHMISCLFLGNEIPRDYLTHLLKVKVDLDRLTPRKIDEIQKNLHPNADTGVVYRKKPGPKSWQRDIEIRSDAQSDGTAMASQVTTKNTQKTTDKNGEIPTEKAAEDAKTANEDGNDDKPVTRKPRAKKTPSKSKNTNGEVNDEFQIAGNQTISLNWIDEAIKDKPFSLRNFETDKPIYNAIKSMPFSDALTKEKLATLIRTINLRKGSSISLLKRNQNSYELNVTVPAQSAEIDTNRPKSVENGVQSNTDNTVTHTSANVTTVQPPLQSPNQAKAQNLPRTPGRLNSPQVSVAQPVSVISMAPPQASPATANPPTAATAAIPTLPQLLSLPTRVPMRTRTMSMCMSQSEYSQVAARLPSTRRQSVCDNNQAAKTNSPSALSKATALDHSYTNSSAAKTPESAKVPNRLNGVPYLPPPYMTKVHNADFLQARPTPPPAHMQPPLQPQSQPQPTASKTPQLPVTTLKVLTPDDLNSRAMNAAPPSQPSPNTRMDSPNSTENHASNVNNNNNQVSSTKRPRTKTTPLRPLAPAPAPPQLDDDANISISVSLSRVGTGRAELILTLDNQRLRYDDLSKKRKQEVQQSLLKDNVWLQMLTHLKSIQPTNETLTLFEKILPKPQQDQFFSELKRVYGNRIG